MKQLLLYIKDTGRVHLRYGRIRQDNRRSENTPSYRFLRVIWNKIYNTSEKQNNFHKQKTYYWFKEDSTLLLFSRSDRSDSLQPHGLKLILTESVISFNHLILCCPLLLLPSIFPSIRVFSNESALHIRCPKLLEFQLQHQSFQWIFRVDFL